MKTIKLLLATALLVALCTGFSSCSKEESSEDNITKTVFNGYVQKGPYINGSSVTITQLDNQLNQTGVTFSTKIADNSGNFEERNIKFTSPFVELKADGYYFNEVEGKLSDAPITLYALADISDANSVNINILTHLERPRLEYLIKEKEINFANAKLQARREILNIFGVSLTNDKSLEQLNLSNDAILLMVSSIVQGHLRTGEVSELLAAIGTDIRADGKLDSPALGSQLANNVAFINIDNIQSNLVKKYTELEKAYSIATNDLNKYIQDFKANTNYKQTLFITYPKESRYGINILADEVTAINTGSYYSLKADVPAGTKLKIIIKGEKDPSEEDSLKANVPIGAKFKFAIEKNYYMPWGGFDQGSEENWHIGQYDQKTDASTLTSIKGGKSCDVRVRPYGKNFIIEYYENETIEATKVKQIKVIPSE